MKEIEVRPARAREGDLAAGLMNRLRPPPGTSSAPPPLLHAAYRNLMVAACGDRIVGLCLFIPSAGRCAVILPPRMSEWNVDLAARLTRAAAAQAHAKSRARLIQCFTEPEGRSPMAEALERAAFEPLAVLIYMRRKVWPTDRNLDVPSNLKWRRYTPWRRREFARTITLTYEDSLDCPKLAGLRTADDAIATHKHTGTFTPRAWHLATAHDKAIGVGLVNNLQGCGDVVYLGVVPAARGGGIGKALLARAVRDTAAMGLPAIRLTVDAENRPAVRLYEGMEFREIRRRLVYFVPKQRLAELDAEATG